MLMSLVPACLGPGRNEWLAASGGPFLMLNPANGHLSPVPARGLTMGLPDVRSLVRDPATKKVWGGTRLGLYVFDSLTTAFRAYVVPGTPAETPPPFAGRTVEDVWADGRGHLWLATPEGVERLTITTGARRLYAPTADGPDRVPADGTRCLYGDAAGRLWIGTRTHGLVVIDRNGRARAALTLADGLPNTSIATILPGPDGALWLGTYQGLVRYQPATGTLASFTTAHGLLSDECNARAAAVDPVDQSLLIGGVAGLHRVWPTQVPGARPHRPRLLLTAITTLSASTAASQPRYLLPADPLPALRLAPDRPIVDLHLALSGDLDPGRTRYAYRIAGWLGGQWLPLGTTARLRLQGLPPGGYEVEVRGATSEGVEAANQLRLALTVTAEWWRRPVVWALGALAAVLLVYAWQRARLRQARRETALRANLAADLHDEVGALLNRVTLQAELLREFREGPPVRLDALVEDSRAAATTVRDIIWSVDATADTLAALIDRIRDHLDATARATSWTVTFDAHELPADLSQPLPPAVRQHAYLIFKEAVTNAMRHAPSATTLTVGLRYAPPLLELTVTNDGCPAGSNQPTRAGQGLRNMRHRADLLRADLTMGPRPAGGWALTLRVPV